MEGEYFVRLKSHGGKQTQRTKARQKDFAVAASLSRKVRFMLQSIIPDPKQKSMQNRLTKALMQWQLERHDKQNTLTLIKQLVHFGFTEETPLDSVCSVPFKINKTAEDRLQIAIPPFKPKQAIKAPEQTKEVHIHIAAGRCGITQRKQPERIYKQIILSYSNKQTTQQIIELPLKPLAGSITVIGVSLSFWVEQGSNASLVSVKQKAWSPATVIFAEVV